MPAGRPGRMGFLRLKPNTVSKGADCEGREHQIGGAIGKYAEFRGLDLVPRDNVWQRPTKRMELIDVQAVQGQPRGHRPTIWIPPLPDSRTCSRKSSGAASKPWKVTRVRLQHSPPRIYDGERLSGDSSSRSPPPALPDSLSDVVSIALNRIEKTRSISTNSRTFLKLSQPATFLCGEVRCCNELVIIEHIAQNRSQPVKNRRFRHEDPLKKMIRGAREFYFKPDTIHTGKSRQSHRRLART